MGESPAPLRGAARRPPALRPAGTVPPDRAALAAAGTVLGGHGASIEARFHRARHLVPAKADTVSRRPGPAGIRNPSRHVIPQSPQPLKTRNPSRHAIRPDTQSVSPHPGGGGTAGPIGPAGWCRQSAARFLVPPNGAAQNRLAKARLKTGGGPAARRPDRAGGMVPPDWAARGMVPGNCPARGMVPAIAGTVWCRQSAARSTVPAKAGTVPGGAVLGSREQSADWRTVLAGRQIGIGDSPAWMRSLGMRSLGMRMSGDAEPGNADVRGCGAWECGCLGACGAGGCGCPGMRSLGMRSLGGNAESGDCPPADWPAEAVPPDRAAQNGAAFWQHLPPPDSAAASRAAGRLAGGKKLGGGGV